MGGLDFAGGLVVHMTSGYSAVVAALTIGNRTRFKPHDYTGFSAPIVLLGTALLWFGWFGFNAGSALGANGLAAHAAATTFCASVGAMTVWMFHDWILGGRPSAVGAAIGAVAGLVAITPAAGYVSLQSAMFIGAASALACNVVARLVKKRLQFDDTVDVFACHGVGGTMGALLTAVFADKAINPAGADGVIFGSNDLFVANLMGAVCVAMYSMIATYLIVQIVNIFTPVRVSEEEEKSGLDLTQHGEKAFT